MARRLIGAVALVASVLAGAHAVFASSGGAASTVNVRLREMVVLPSTKHVRAGKVTFLVRNVGTVEHEMLVIRGSSRLPVEAFRAPESRSLGEVSELPPGKSGRVTLDLKRGHYLLICNIAGHYQLGMVSTFDVS
jgi:uncharacterized cupredoxin-like copper-binding protein